jgi:hypothetical protein
MEEGKKKNKKWWSRNQTLCRGTGTERQDRIWSERVMRENDKGAS